MTPKQRREVEKSKALFTRRYPGVLARLEKLPGEYLPTVPYQSLLARSGIASALQIWIAYYVHAKGGIYVRMRVLLEEERPDEWINVNHKYHFGADASVDDDEDASGGTLFRVCRNFDWPHHFHQKGHENVHNKGHIPAAKANPPLQDDPAWFLGLLEHFIEHDQIPVEVMP